MSLSTTQGILVGTLVVAAGFAAREYSSDMDPALKALNNYTEAVSHIQGVGFTEVEFPSRKCFSLVTPCLEQR